MSCRHVDYHGESPMAHGLTSGILVYYSGDYPLPGSSIAGSQRSPRSRCEVGVVDPNVKGNLSALRARWRLAVKELERVKRRTSSKSRASAGGRSIRTHLAAGAKLDSGGSLSSARVDRAEDHRLLVSFKLMRPHWQFRSYPSLTSPRLQRM